MKKKQNGYDSAKVWVMAWIGDKSYMMKPPSVSHMIFQTRAEARRAGWKKPQRVRIELMEPRYE